MSSATIRSVNPAAPDEVVAEVAQPTTGELESILTAAATAQPRWADQAAQRSAALTRFADAIVARENEFVDLMVREVGKPLVEAAAEVARAVAILRYYAQLALDATGEVYPGSAPDTTVVVRRQPLGVVLCICPWNFPLAIPIWKAAPALAFGNAVISKPAGPAVGVGALMGEVAAESLPEGVLAVAAVSGATAGDLLDDERIAAATFTGSTQVGIDVVSRLARRAAPAQAEMGGQNPAIVLADADIDAAAARIVAGAMSYAGQKCTATRRAIAVGSAAEPLAEAIAREVAALTVGDPAAEDTTVGPLINERSASEFGARIEGAMQRGAGLVARADAPEGAGHYVAPTVLAIDDVDDEANQEETFGPLLTLITVADDDSAVAAANATRYGLVGAVHGTDLQRAVAIANRLDCGLQRVNAPTPGVDYYAPFGGNRLSSFGPREQGRAARDFFTETRTLTIVSA